MGLNSPTQSGTSCVHTAADITSPADITVYFWYRAENTGTVTFNSFSYLGPGAAVDGFDLFFQGSGVDRIQFERRYSGTDGIWHLTAANYGVPPSRLHWRWLGISLSGTGPPTIYHSSMDDVTPVSRTVVTATAPTGSPDAGGSCQLHIGNWENHDGALNGDMANFGLHSAALNSTEMAQAMWSGPPSNGLIYASRLENSTLQRCEDLSTSDRALTLNGTPAVIRGPFNAWGMYNRFPDRETRPDYKYLGTGL